MAKATFNKKKKTLVTSKLDLNFKKVDQKYLEVLKCGAGEGWRKSVG